MAPDPPSDYRVSPVLAARLVGVALAVVAVVVFVVTAASAWLGAGLGPVLVVAAVGVLAAGAVGWWVTRRATVVRVDDVGYRVRFVRGVGAPAARWTDVRDTGVATVAGSRCLVLRLRDGRSTTIPTEALAVGHDAFSAAVRARLATALRRSHRKPGGSEDG